MDITEDIDDQNKENTIDNYREKYTEEYLNSTLSKIYDSIGVKQPMEVDPSKPIGFVPNMTLNHRISFTSQRNRTISKTRKRLVIRTCGEDAFKNKSLLKIQNKQRPISLAVKSEPISPKMGEFHNESNLNYTAVDVRPPTTTNRSRSYNRRLRFKEQRGL